MSKKRIKKETKKLMDTDNTVVTARGREGMEVEEDKGRVSGDRRDLPRGHEHTIPCTDDVMQNCAPETCLLS